MIDGAPEVGQVSSELATNFRGPVFFLGETMATLPNVPMMPSGPAQPSMNALLGNAAAMPQAALGVEDAVVGVSRQIRTMLADVDTIARQFPETGEAGEQVKQLLVSMMTQIVGTERGPESGPSPGVMG